ncbi:class I SAM-dependent methyltransferase [[Clostridium] polysaccharolyticum]|uniref:Methyltransferase domain-containing protein n=1 Tax=[Clostridium] polysaccharolyticum TaxID=29364 RepID=A0A1I0DQQ6_9FIRM|nr:class I SAM-dependent methyltransferase [[Clostridium] polysaccharolyticum]SET34587.1 Methyltransferase domain-containing protein [[Clostridium] polysaccharolyticum]
MIFTDGTFLDLSRKFTWRNEDRRKIISFLKEELNDQSKKVLEVGCGNGIITKSFAQQALNSTFIGIDIQGDLIDQARRECDLENLTYETVDFCKEEYENEYDVIYSHFLLVDCKQADKILENMYKALKIGGTICCFEPFYQTDGLNSYMPFLNEKEKSKLRELSRELLIDIPRKNGISRDYAASIPNRFYAMRLSHIEIEIIPTYELSEKYDVYRKRFILSQAKEIMKDRQAYREKIYTSKLYSQLTQEQLDDYCNIQLKIVEEIVSNPKAFFSYRIFSAGSMLAIKGVR